ncbi:MAG TPA: hypothetical protein VL984_10665 [Acidimicrobiales bacterium]|nr:hypothetical protein [Acidimicrobiales bacterium]
MTSHDRGANGVRCVVVVVVAGLSVVLAACGGSPSSSGVAHIGKKPAVTTTTLPAGPAGTYVPQAEILDFVHCLRAHGVPNFPDPLPSGGFARSQLSAVNTSSPQFKSALGACRALAIATGFEQTPAEIEEHVEQETAEDACIRKHGVPNMPDPDAQGSQSFPPGISPSTPRFEAAQKVCAYLNS